MPEDRHAITDDGRVPLKLAFVRFGRVVRNPDTGRIRPSRKSRRITPEMSPLIAQLLCRKRFDCHRRSTTRRSDSDSPQRCRQRPNVSEHSSLILTFHTQDYNPGVLAGRVSPNIRRVRVQGHQDSTLRLARACNDLIIRPREVLLPNRIRDETGATQNLGCFGRQVLIRFEFHAVSPVGRSMEPSRANSAA